MTMIMYCRGVMVAAEFFFSFPLLAELSIKAKPSFGILTGAVFPQPLGHPTHPLQLKV